MPIKRIIAYLVMAFCITQTGSATSFHSFTLKEAIDQGRPTAIVHAKVVRQVTNTKEGQIHTCTQFQVDRRFSLYRGGRDRFYICAPGGRIKTKTGYKEFQIASSPRFAANDEVILFLQDNAFVPLMALDRLTFRVKENRVFDHEGLQITSIDANGGVEKSSGNSGISVQEFFGRLRSISPNYRSRKEPPHLFNTESEFFGI